MTDVASRLTAMMQRFAEADFARVEPAILQPADVFLDLSGEEMRRRLLLVSDPAGSELCLRPDMTIPVSRSHLANGDPARAARYYYVGPVFRHRPGSAEHDEFLQAGIERFGDTDAPAADAEIMALGLEAAKTLGAASLDIRIGDPTIFLAFAEALELAAGWQRRLRAGFGSAGGVAAVLAASQSADTDGAASTYATALAKVDPEVARRLVAEMADIAGIAPVGGRSADEIADRLIERASLGGSRAMPAEARAVLEKLAAIKDAPARARDAIAALAGEAGIAVDDALTAMTARLDALAAAGLDTDTMRFAAGYGRRLDYYSGFVFEAHLTGNAAAGQIVGGGRYDTLLSQLGSAEQVPGVGCAIWVERALGKGGVS